MRACHPGSLQTFLNSGAPFRRAELFTITLADGTVARYTSYDRDLDLTGVDTPIGYFTHLGPLIQRQGVTHRIGLQVDTMQMSISPKDTDTIGGANWFDAFRSGALDYATVSLDMGILGITPEPPDWKGYFNWFYGYISDIGEVNAGGAIINVRSALGMFDVLMPRNLIQPGCLNSLYDAACTVNATSHTSSITISSAAGAVLTTSYGGATGTLDLGRLLMTSGPNSSVARKIKAQVGGTIYLYSPLYYPIVGGETASVRVGCDKSHATCVSKFSNGVNFRGMRFVPVPETLTG